MEGSALPELSKTGKKSLLSKPFYIVCICNAFFVLSIFLAYADSHGMLGSAVWLEGSFANKLANVIYAIADIPSVILLFFPYGFFLVIQAIVHLIETRKNKSENPHRIKALFAAILLFAVTLSLKILYGCVLAASILYPDSFHF